MFVLDFHRPFFKFKFLQSCENILNLLFSEVTEVEAKPAEPEPVKHPEVDKAALKEQVKCYFKEQVKTYF